MLEAIALYVRHARVEVPPLTSHQRVKRIATRSRERTNCVELLLPGADSLLNDLLDQRELFLLLRDEFQSRLSRVDDVEVKLPHVVEVVADIARKSPLKRVLTDQIELQDLRVL